MSAGNARARVAAARLQLAEAEREAGTVWQSLRERFERHRALVLIGGGLLAGVALAGAAPKQWSRAGATLFGTAARLMRSSLGPVLVGAWLSGLRGHLPADPARTPEAGAAATPGATS
jgi:hypothetical protein